MRACETLPRKNFSTMRLDAASIFGELFANPIPYEVSDPWHSVVEQYSKCGLTRGSDKLVALAGIAQVVQTIRSLPDLDYLAGHWKPNLREDPLWYAPDRATRAPEYRAPSWSWASIDGTIAYSDEYYNYDVHYRFKIVEASVVLRFGNTFGPIASGRIRLEGTLYRLLLEKDENERQMQDISKVTFHGDVRARTSEVRTYWDDCRLDQNRFTTAYYLHYRDFHKLDWDNGTGLTPIKYLGLMLQRVHEHEGRYRRVGLLEMEQDETEAWFQSRPTRSSLHPMEHEELRPDEYEKLHYDGRVTISII